MDAEMPIINGFEASRQIKAKIQNENYIPTNIISYSCNSADKQFV